MSENELCKNDGKDGDVYVFWSVNDGMGGHQERFTPISLDELKKKCSTLEEVDAFVKRVVQEDFEMLISYEVDTDSSEIFELVKEHKR